MTPERSLTLSSDLDGAIADLSAAQFFLGSGWAENAIPHLKRLAALFPTLPDRVREATPYLLRAASGGVPVLNLDSETVEYRESAHHAVSYCCGVQHIGPWVFGLHEVDLQHARGVDVSILIHAPVDCVCFPGRR